MAEKQIAVLVTDRQGEGLRMSLGLLLLGNGVDVYVLDRDLERTEETRLHLETIEEFEVPMYTNRRENEGIRYLSTEEVARKLVQYDHVLPY